MYITQDLRDFYGRVIGYIETDSITGDKIGRDFYRRVVGYYDKKLNITRDFYKRTVGHGDILSSLIYQANEKLKKK